MSSPAATEGAYQDGYGSTLTPSDQDIHQSDRRQGHGSRGFYEHHQDDSQSSPSTPTAQGGVNNRRGGLSEISNHFYSQRQAVEQHMQSPDEIMNAAAIASRDKNLDNFTTNSATATATATASFDFHNVNDSQHSPPPTAHVPLQIRYTPHSRQGSIVSHSRQGSIASHSRQGSVTGLQIRTDIPSAKPKSTAVASRDHIQQLHPSISSHTLDSVSSASATLTPTGNLRKAISTASLSSSLSPNGGMLSPALAAMIDITPLPSPIMPGEQLSPVPWKRVRSTSRNRTNELERPSTLAGAEIGGPSSQPPPRFHMPMSPASPPKKKKGYGNLLPAAVEGQASPSTTQVNAQVNALAHDQNQMAHQKQRVVSHGRNRSISDFVPEQLHNVRPRHVTVNLSSAPLFHPVNHDPTMHREQYLATQRGHPSTTASPLSVPATLLDPSNPLPSPPPSNKSVSSELDEEDYHPVLQDQEDANVEYFQVRDAHNPSKKRKWRAIRELGQGTFSKVMLASSERLPPGTPYTSDHLNPSKLVAIKIVEHGPAGGADEERIGVSLKREVDILKSVSHPCIVQLKAMEYSEDRALLVLTFCPGGDLFELASQNREVLTRNMVQRIFAEVVAAVRYLHEMGVVHRDLKLENILVHPTPDFLQKLSQPQKYPHPLISVTDLGLSRRIPPPPASPLLTTRCGSEDYAAPEILLGQPYDGRATDAWALGVLLYALMEGRLPFDCPPGKPERSRVSHRVARCDWIWGKWGDEDGEWDAANSEADEWRPAGECVEGLLKKVRMGRKPLSEIEEMIWVKEGISVPGGLTRVDDGGGDL